MSWAFGLYGRKAPQKKQQLRQRVEIESLADKEMKIFAERVINSLLQPEKGTPNPLAVKNAQTIYDVLEGRKDFKEWFIETRRNFNLRSYELASIIYNALDGLRSEEAVELREQWKNFVIEEAKRYGL